MTTKTFYSATALWALSFACGNAPEPETKSPVGPLALRANEQSNENASRGDDKAPRVNEKRKPPPAEASSEEEIRARILAAKKREEALLKRLPEEELEDLINESNNNPPQTHFERQLLMANAARLLRQLPKAAQPRVVQRVGAILSDPQWLTD